jgi:hypothetical protein
MPQIDRPHRLGHGDVERAVDGGFHGFAVRQLVIPFDEFAQHGALIAHFLGPMDFAAAHAHQPAFFGIRRASRGEEHGDVAAPAIDDAAERIGGADIHMDHHGLRASRFQVIALRHGDGDVLMRHRDGLGHFRALHLRLRIGLDDGREIRTRVGE